MLENRKLKLDLLALALLAAVMFLAAALLTHDPADQPGAAVYPRNAQPANACGHAGAVVSQLLLHAFGLGAYYLLASLALFDGVLLIRHEINQIWLRLGGWTLSLAAAATLAALLAPSLDCVPPIGAGGYVGAVGKSLLETQFAGVGSVLISVSLILGGLLLASDYIVIRLLIWAVGKPSRTLGRGALRVSQAYARRLTPKRSDLDDAPAADAPPIRTSRRQAAKPAADDANNEPEEEQKQSAPTSQPRIKKPFGARVGISRPHAEKKKLFEDIDESDLGGKASDYELPSLDLLLEGETADFDAQEKDVRRKAQILEKTFLDFGFNVRVVEILTGPVIAQFEVELEAGLRLSKITGLADDLAIALRVPSVRIVAPLPGKNTVGIEVPNQQRQIVRLREVMEEGGDAARKMRIPLFLGKDVSGNPLLVDLTTLPHLLIAGRTGTGKSVCLNSIISSILMTRRPDEVRMLMIDPKMVELNSYRNLPHLMHPLVTDMRKAEAILGWAVEKMEERYHILARAGVRHLAAYNQLGEEELLERIQPEDEQDRAGIPTHMPYIVIVADELADLMMTAAKEVEGHIIRLAQKSRAVGIHLVLATQKPTVDVITGLIKSNLPARIAFQVASRTDSRVVLDEMGAERLLGNGDMLFLWPGTSTILRGQGTYLCDEEISRLIAATETTEPQFVKELVQLKTKLPDGEKQKFSDRDELYESAIDIVVREGRGSVSLLQRALGIGYGRAARLIDFMAEDGIVGPYNGSQAREILLSLEQWEQRGKQGQSAETQPKKNRLPSRIVLDQPEAEDDEDVDDADDVVEDDVDNVTPFDADGEPLDEQVDEDYEDEEEGDDEADEDIEDEADDDEPTDEDIDAEADELEDEETEDAEDDSSTLSSKESPRRRSNPARRRWKSRSA
jgi:S-DNA-T family DNA segregation ATPase FtsK/SpoIIIE